jgi:hypothetical protein
MSWRSSRNSAATDALIERAWRSEATPEEIETIAIRHNPTHTFRVRTRLGDASALGTRFELSTAAEERVAIG